jgi:hypothetical protein
MYGCIDPLPPGLDVQRAASGSESDMGKGKESGIESGERAAMDAENVRKWARERGCECGRENGACTPGVVGVAGMLVSRDADDDA